MNIRSVITIGLPALAGLILVSYVWNALPPSQITIEAGPQEGTYYAHAMAYAEVMQSHGFDVTVLSNPNSNAIVDNVNNPASGVDIGFVAQAIVPEALPNVAGVARIEMQPLFLFSSIALGELVTLANLQRRSIVMPPAGSATATAATEILSIYGVTDETAQIVHLPIQQAAKELQEGRFDAGFFMLAPDNPIIESLATDINLAAFSYSDARSMTIKLDYLSSTRLPAGGFDLGLLIPPFDLDLVGSEVTVVAKANLHPAALYALVEGIERRHQGATAVSLPGEYPAFSATRLPLPDTLANYEISGTPWAYRFFGLRLGSLIEEFSVLILGLFIATQAYRTLKYSLEALELGAHVVASAALRRQQRLQNAGKGTGPASRLIVRFASSVIERETVRMRARRELEATRASGSGQS